MDEHVLTTYLRSEEVFVSGHGAEIVDQSGRVYLDFLGGIGVSALGHGHPELRAALHDQIDRLLHTSNLYRHEHADAVAERVARLCGLEAVFFTNSGAEAVEAALKIALKHQHRTGFPERTGFVALEGAFHGRTLGALSITHSAKYRAPFGPLLPGVRFVAPEDVAGLEAALRAHTVAGLIVEPIQGEAGVRELSPGFLRACRRLCDETHTVLIHDEVQCGSGRTGDFLAAQAACVAPDVVTLAKPIGAGLPMGLVVVAREFADVFVPGDHGSTFAGGPLVCRAALVFLRALEEGRLFEAVAQRGRELAHGLLQLQREFPIVLEVRGRGLIQGLRLARGAEELQKTLYRDGLITNRTGGDVIRLLPPYVIRPQEIERGLEILRTNLARV